MTAEEKSALLADLESGRSALIAAIEGVTEEEAGRQPSFGGWTILECVEHLAISEEYLVEQIRRAAPADRPAANPQREARIRRVGRDRTIRIPAPAEGAPRGRFRTLAEAATAYLAARDGALLLVEGCGEDLRARMTSHPIAGRVNCYEVLLMIAAHPHRHSEQIRQIRESLRQG